MQVLIDTVANLENSNSYNYGIQSGQMGLCIANFLLAKALEDEKYENRAKEILDAVSDNIANIQQFDFATGLAGIGWGIEWLVQNKYIDANTDEILEDLDDELYKSVVYAKSANNSLQNGTIGKAMYFYKRLLAQNPHSEWCRTIALQECLVLLIDELHDGLLDDENGLLAQYVDGKEVLDSELELVAESLIFLVKILPLRINIEIAERLVVSIIDFIQKTTFYKKSKEYEYFLFSYMLAGKYLKQDVWVNNAKEIYAQSFPRSELDLFSLICTDSDNSNEVLKTLSLISASSNNITNSWKEAWLLG